MGQDGIHGELIIDGIKMARNPGRTIQTPRGLTQYHTILRTCGWQMPPNDAAIAVMWAGAGARRNTTRHASITVSVGQA